MERQASTDVFHPSHDKQRSLLIEWINNTLVNVNLPGNASDEDLRAFLVDGSVLCEVLNKYKPGSIEVIQYGSGNSSKIGSENVKKLLAAMYEMGLPIFQVRDIEKGSMKIVIDCLLTLRSRLIVNGGGYELSAASLASPFSVTHKGSSESSFYRLLRSPLKSEPSAALLHHVGNNFQEVFQIKHGCYADIPSAKISEMINSTRFDNAPTQSLLSVVNGILDEGQRKNGEIPYRVACLLRKVVQEIERRIFTQAEHLKTQNQLFKVREEKYQSRIKVLEALAAGTGEETQVLRSQVEIAAKGSQEVESLKKELEIAKNNYDQLRLQMNTDANGAQDINLLKQELETTRKGYEQKCLQLETEAKGVQQDLEEKLKELERYLTESKSRIRELETTIQSESRRWKKREHIYQICAEFQISVLRELKISSVAMRQEVTQTQKSYVDDFSRLGTKIKVLEKAAENYHVVLTENRKMNKELQDLKGNIRVYCRIRPFLPGQKAKQSIVEYVGDNGELTVVNPSKQGKEVRRSFKFNQVYGSKATQVDVYSEIRPLIQSVLDGYNVCIFAYGQTGSGKTYTMSGPDGASEEEWGVNYRAMNDLFNISQRRGRTCAYEIGVQMVEIYNEQVRDLLSSGSQKKLGVSSNSQASGLAVPDASMHPVQSSSDVMEFMEIGLKNRAKSSTAMNERSSRSHSVLTVHARGTDLKTGSLLRGNLHLVDLAGSERIDRSEVTGDRLKEAQHINKSLAALGDVIFALAQKSAHVPYRNSKLTQVLQSSLGGQAKTIMFVQLNPEAISYTESLSTLKFAERVSGVELGAARSSKETKEGNDVKELMEQVASLKDTIGKKDEEISRLQQLKNGEKRAVATRYQNSPSI
nr:PREDICTED: kinesin-4-like [Daucus carota subsp. sativus]